MLKYQNVHHLSWIIARKLNYVMYFGGWAYRHILYTTYSYTHTLNLSENLKHKNWKCSSLEGLESCRNRTSSRFALEARIQDQLGWCTQDNLNSRIPSKPTFGPDCSRWLLFWGSVALELPSEVSLVYSIWGNLAGSAVLQNPQTRLNLPTNSRHHQCHPSSLKP